MTRDDAIALMIRLEGGFVDNPRDPGGATKYGITQRALTTFMSTGHSDFNSWPRDVYDLTSSQAAAIYRAVDWDAMHCDDMPAPLACLLLNSAVNQGEPTAVRLLQESLGLRADGIIGPQTLAEIHAWKSPYMPEQTLAEEFAARAAVRYASLFIDESEFELGWFRRLFRVYTAAAGA